jgi:hypothetical protein
MTFIRDFAGEGEEISSWLPKKKNTELFRPFLLRIF